MTRRKQHIGSHNQQARPEQKMSRRRGTVHTMNDGREFGPYPTSTGRQVMQKILNAKRRRRDKDTADGID